MVLFSVLMLAAATPLAGQPPRPLTSDHIRDLGCVAVVAIAAERQRQGLSAATAYPDMQLRGRNWAGIVGDRVTFESGQAREIVAFAMREAAAAEQVRMAQAGDADVILGERLSVCLPSMESDLAADAGNLPLPIPIKKQR